jgi:hypothetical protein
LKYLRNLLSLLRNGPAEPSVPSPASVKTVTEGGDRLWLNKVGQLHRDDGPAIECANGDKAWFRNDELHRDDGPAVEYADGGNAWYLNERLHRVDGPAIERIDGYTAWYVDGLQITQKQIAVLQARAKERRAHR